MKPTLRPVHKPKNQSAAEVAELTLAEIKRLTESSVAADELVPRKSSLRVISVWALRLPAGLLARDQ